MILVVAFFCVALLQRSAADIPALYSATVKVAADTALPTSPGFLTTASTNVAGWLHLDPSAVASMAVTDRATLHFSVTTGLAADWPAALALLTGVVDSGRAFILAPENITLRTPATLFRLLPKSLLDDASPKGQGQGAGSGAATAASSGGASAGLVAGVVAALLLCFILIAFLIQRFGDRLPTLGRGDRKTEAGLEGQDEFAPFQVQNPLVSMARGASMRARYGLSGAAEDATDS